MMYDLMFDVFFFFLYPLCLSLARCSCSYFSLEQSAWFYLLIIWNIRKKKKKTSTDNRGPLGARSDF